MRLLKQALALLGALVVVALIAAFIAPNRANALAAALVQIVPGTTTHVGQNESQLVALTCLNGNNFCNAVDPNGDISTSPYVVPAGYTLIITDYEWVAFTKLGPGVIQFSGLVSIGDYPIVKTILTSTGLTDNLPTLAIAHLHDHFVTGVRVGSGVTLADVQAENNTGFSSVQGYLVPND
jgi:hypothetical protein